MGGDESSRPGERRDELDDLIDQAFGPATTVAPGRSDLGLLAMGGVLLAWWLAAGGSGPGFALGVALLALGAAVPVRSVIVVSNLRRRGRRRDG